MADVTMPQLGETVTEGTITKWNKAVGEEVAEDEILFEVSTDKVDSEVPSPFSGSLTEIRVQEGETAEVGAVLAVIGASASREGDKAVDAGDTSGEVPPAAIEVTEAAELHSLSPDAKPAAEARPVNEASKLVLMSPVVRKLVSEHGIDVSKIRGSGLGGRITRNDVLAVVNSGGYKPMSGPQVSRATDVKPLPPKAETQTKPADKPAIKPAPGQVVKAGKGDEAIPFSRIRKVTANHMVMSKATSAHTTTAIEVDFQGVETVRQANKAKFKEQEGTSLTYLPFIARAVVDAIGDFPHVNSSVGEEELIVHKSIDLGIAVDMNFKGLLVPVIRQADSLRLRAIARSVADLAGRARNKKISPDDLVGGTFTITNPGPFGSLFTIAVINQPQTAILSTDGVKKKPVVVTMPDGTDGIAIHPVGLLVLTWDHRAFDGAYAAAFNARVKEILETRDWSSEF